jgi:glycine/D-amino acid oxidase-like deaminating enzyme
MARPLSSSREAHVVIVGSGPAGLAAALAAREQGAAVSVLERAGRVGGTTAISGGVAWLPGNHRMRELGIAHSGAAAGAYLRSLALGDADMGLLDTFVAAAPRVAAGGADGPPLARASVCRRWSSAGARARRPEPMADTLAYQPSVW